MSILDIFKQDAFSVIRLTDALREIKYVPCISSGVLRLMRPLPD